MDAHCLGGCLPDDHLHILVACLSCKRGVAICHGCAEVVNGSEEMAGTVAGLVKSFMQVHADHEFTFPEEP